MKNDTVQFSGYKMAFCAAVIFLATFGLGYFTLSLYLPSLVQEMNVNLGIVSIMFGVTGITSMLASFASGPLIGKIGLKRTIMIGSLCLLIGYVLLYFAYNIVMVFISTAFIGIAFSWAGSACVGNVVPNWFIKKQGTMIGLVIASVGIGGLVGSPTISWIISNYGWRTACLVTAIVLAVLHISALIFLKGSPSEVGQLPLGYQANAGETAYKVTGIGFDRAKSSASFWLLTLMVICFSLLVSGVNAHVPTFITSQKYTLVFAGTILAIVSVANMIGNVLLGTIIDKAGLRVSVTWGAFVSVISLVLMFFSGNQILAMGFGVFFGLTNPLSGTLLPMLVSPIFGVKDFAKILGVFNGAVALAGIAAPILIGMSVTATGSYTLSITCLIVVVIVGYIAGMLGISKGKSLQRKVNNIGTTL